MLQLALVGAAGAAAVAALSGCGETQAVEVVKEKTKEAPVEKTAVVTAAASPVAKREAITMRFMTRGSPTYLEYFDFMAKTFSEKNPHITVNTEPQEDYHTVLITQVAAGTPPDIVFTTNDFMWEEAINGVLMDLEPYFKSSGLNKADYYPSAMEPQYLRGKLFAMPVDMGIWALWYNKDLFETEGVDPPNDKWTYDEFIEAGKKMTRDSAGRNANDPAFDYAKAVQFGDHGSWRYGWKTPLEGFGGKWISDDKLTSHFDSPEAMASFQWIKDMIFKHKMTISPTQPRDFPVGLNTGKTAMKYGGSWEISNLLKVTFKWDVVPTPAGPKQWATMGEASGISTPKGAKYADEAWELNLAMTGAEGQTIGFQYGVATVPAIISVAEQVYRSQTIGNLQLLLDGLPKASYPFYQEAISGRLLDNAFSAFGDEMYVQDKDVKDVLPRMKAEVDKILAAEAKQTFPPGI